MCVYEIDEEMCNVGLFEKQVNKDIKSFIVFAIKVRTREEI